MLLILWSCPGKVARYTWISAQNMSYFEESYLELEATFLIDNKLRTRDTHTRENSIQDTYLLSKEYLQYIIM